MTKTDTIRRVARPRGVLTDQQIKTTRLMRDTMEAVQREYREWVVDLLDGGGSFNEVSKATGLSKDTLQRWKREAGR